MKKTRHRRVSLLAQKILITGEHQGDRKKRGEKKGKEGKRGKKGKRGTRGTRETGGERRRNYHYREGYRLPRGRGTATTERDTEERRNVMRK
jgi:hypothetical protein